MGRRRRAVSDPAYLIYSITFSWESPPPTTTVPTLDLSVIDTAQTLAHPTPHDGH